MKLPLLLFALISLTFSLPAFCAESEEYYSCKKKCDDDCSNAVSDDMALVDERGGGFTDIVASGFKTSMKCDKECNAECDKLKEPSE